MTLTSHVLTRRDALKAAAVGAGFLLLAGCSPTPAPAPEGDVELEYWTMFTPNSTDDPRAAAEQAIFDALATSAGIKLIWKTVPWEVVDTQLMAAVQAGNAPGLTRSRHFMFDRLAGAGTYSSLDEYVTSTFTASDLDDFIVQMKFDNTTYGFLVENNVNGLYYRKDWFDEDGLEIPKDWDEFVEVGLKIKQKRPDIVPYLTFGSTAQLTHTDQIFQPMIHGRGDQLLDSDGRAAFNSQEGIDTYQFLRDCVHKYGIVADNVVSVTYNDQADAFDAGRGAMMIDGSHRYGRYVKANGEAVGVAEIPAGETSVCTFSGWVIVVPTGSPAPDAAWQAIVQRVSPEAQVTWSEMTGGLPVRKSVLNDPYFQTPEAAVVKWWAEYEARSGQLLLVPPTATELNEAMAQAMQQVILDKDASISTILNDAAKKYDAVL